MSSIRVPGSVYRRASGRWAAVTPPVFDSNAGRPSDHHPIRLRHRAGRDAQGVHRTRRLHYGPVLRGAWSGHLEQLRGRHRNPARRLQCRGRHVLLFVVIYPGARAVDSTCLRASRIARTGSSPSHACPHCGHTQSGMSSSITQPPRTSSPCLAAMKSPGSG